MLDVKILGPLVLMFGLLLVATQTFSTTGSEPVTSGPLTVATLQTWGWIFSAMGLAMMYLKIPPAIGKVWAVGVILLIIYIVAGALGWIS